MVIAVEWHGYCIACLHGYSCPVQWHGYCVACDCMIILVMACLFIMQCMCKAMVRRIFGFPNVALTVQHKFCFQES